MYSVIMGHLGSDAVAANSIANIAKNLIVSFCAGLANGGGIIVGNALGIGRADTTTMRVFDKIDFTQLYPNLLTSTVVSPGMIPMVLEDDKMAITAAIKMLTGVDKDNVRVVMIKNTLSLSEIYLSEALLPQAEASERMEVLEEPHPMEFGADGTLAAF